MNIGVDCDGVLADFTKGFAGLLSDITGEPIVYGGDIAPPMWDWPHEVATPREVNEAWNRVKTSPDFWMTLDPLPGAERLFEVLHDVAVGGHNLYFITSRPGENVQTQTAEWLVRYVGILRPSVLVSCAKPYVANGLSLDVMVDDFPNNLIGPGWPSSCRAYLVNRPYNILAQVPRYVTRTDDPARDLEDELVRRG